MISFSLLSPLTPLTGADLGHLSLTCSISFLSFILVRVVDEPIILHFFLHVVSGHPPSGVVSSIHICGCGFSRILFSVTSSSHLACSPPGSRLVIVFIILLLCPSSYSSSSIASPGPVALVTSTSSSAASPTVSLILIVLIPS